VTIQILRRAGWAVIVLLALALATFLMLNVIPGDPARLAAGPGATPAQLAVERVRLGLNHPLAEQYLLYVWHALHGNLGISSETQIPVATSLAQALPVSIELVLAAMIINILISLPLGVIAAVRKDGWADRTVRVFSMSLGGMPVFWLGLLLQVAFAADLKIFPLGGEVSANVSQGQKITGMPVVDSLLEGNWAAFGNTILHLILPALTLAAFFIPIIVRTLRENLISELGQDYIVLARSKGMSERRVVLGHALRNAAVPTLTLLGMQVGWMLGSTVLVEEIYNLPGIGTYAVNAVLQKDLQPVVGVVLTVGLVFVIMNLLVDLLVLGLDPRARLAATAA
jgi:ABC-type dipeptide/oligopeptide/nickel transport system permease component